MTQFRMPEDRDRLDWELLQHTSVTLYFSRDVLAEHTAWLREHQYDVHSFDCAQWATEDGFHTDVSRVLAFPDYYGRNLDAFNDCICTINVPEDGGTALVFQSFDSFHRLAPDRYWHILDIIACWSRFFLLTGRRLLALVHSDDRKFVVKPVGRQPVLWNRTESSWHIREQWEKARRGTDSSSKAIT